MPSIMEEDELGEEEENKNNTSQNKSSVLYNNPTNNPLFTEKKDIGFEGAENQISEGTPLNRRDEQR